MLKFVAGIPMEDELTGQRSSTSPFSSLSRPSPHISCREVVLFVVNPETRCENGTATLVRSTDDRQIIKTIDKNNFKSKN